MQLTFWHRARYWVLLLLVVLITISSHPTIVEISRSAGMESGTILSRYIVFVFGTLFLISINMKSMLKPKEIRTCWLIYLWIALYYLLTFAIFGTKEMMKDLRYIAFCLIAIMIGWQLNMEEKRFRMLLVVFAGMILFVGLMQVFVNIGGFVILDQYQTDNKNSLGVMLATGATIFLVLGLNYHEKGFRKILYIGLALLSLVVLLTIRARASTLVFGIMFLFIMFERYKGKNVVLYILLGLGVAVIVYLFLPESIKNFVHNSFYQHYEGGDITTGRTDRNRTALNFLSDHIYLGNLRDEANIGQIHNYPLNRTFEFGLIFVFPILLIYIYLLIKTFIYSIRSNNRNINTIGYYLLAIPFIVSMAEPTFPFGPGTATVFNFLVFGASLRNTYSESTVVNSAMENTQSY